MTDQNFFFQKWDREASKFDAVMDALPADRLDYRPHPNSHHRGQLSTYIRPMGGRVPSIYGPSADAPPAAPTGRP